MAKTLGIMLLCLAVFAGCGRQEEPAENNEQASTPASSPTPADQTMPESADETVAAQPAEEKPDSVPMARVVVSDAAAEAARSQMAQVPPNMPGLPTKLGDPAYPLVGLTFVKGEPVEFTPGKVYVVEFWATWCPPCKDSIPHLTELSKKYEDQGVVIIGITNENVRDG